MTHEKGFRLSMCFNVGMLLLNLCLCAWNLHLGARWALAITALAAGISSLALVRAWFRNDLRTAREADRNVATRTALTTRHLN